MLLKTAENLRDEEELDDNHGQPLEVQVARLEMMLEVSRALNSTLDLDVLLQSIIKVAIQLTDTEAASILLLDEKKDELHFQAVAGEKQGQLETISVPLDDSIAGWIIKSGEPIVIYNLREDERHYSEIDRLTDFETRSILGVPLTIKDRIIGVIEVLNKREDTDFTGGDIQTLTTLATQAAIAIENARLFKQNDQLVNVFHELSSPMASIIGHSQLMLSTPDIDNDDMRSGLESINREATRLSHIVNDFLDLAKIETGRVSMNKSPVDFETLIREVINLFYPQSIEKEITLSLDTVAKLPPISADRDRLKQALISLIDNAIKYNRRHGDITIRLSCNEVRAQISIQDTGRGILPHDLELIFDKFYRVQNDMDEFNGAGLGLALAKKIVEAHQGDIWVESEMGVGSIFTFSLPLQS